MTETYNCLCCGKECKCSHQKVNKYCSNSCQRKAQTAERTRQWLEEGKDWKRQVPDWAKEHIAKVKGYKCSICNLDEWQGKKIILEVDHIDGLYYNNNINNLRFMCPNCHSQTDTYKNKNKGNGRDYR